MQKLVKPKRKPLQILLTEEQLTKLKTEAYSNGVSMNQFILSKLSEVIDA